MENRSVITYWGDLNLFEDLETSLVQAVPKEATEWKRPYGRVVKSVTLDVRFVSFSKECISKDADNKLLGQPILHTFWTECSDLDTYKTSVKADIEQWFKSIGGAEADWMIVLVEVYDIRKSNKLLPRTTVMDKVRTDFAVKQGDRVLALIHPIKSESKSAESWRGLVNRIRAHILSAYNKILLKFEETVRANRERRPQPNWSYCAYFTMQEELALVLEMLGLHEEALVQYDELDALFTQFVLNSTKCETPKWLSSFSVPLQQWAGPTLNQKVTNIQRDLLRCSKLDLLQFRSYLFGRQCSLLVLMGKPWEMAQRALSFLHNCVLEMRILEVSAPEGAVATWVFLVCLEVLRTCEQLKDPKQVKACSLHTADLWAYARDKLKQLGNLCGLTPGPGPNSEQLHAVVELSSGMGDPPISPLGPTPVDRLKEALSSKEAYNSYFLELSELAISTYKHIGRLRYARLIAQDLAEFYLALNQPDKASTFLTSSLQGFLQDQWTALASSTQLRLVDCYSAHTADLKFITCCASLACSDLDTSTRTNYYNKFMDSLKLFAQDTPVVTSLGDIGKITGIDVQPRHLIRRGQCEIVASLSFWSRMPTSLKCSSIRISIIKGSAETSQAGEVAQKVMFKKLPMSELVDFKEDGSLHAANIICREPQKALRRTDSQGRGRKVSSPNRGDFSLCLVTKDVTLQPGHNCITLSWMAENVGRYVFDQLSISLPGLELLESVSAPPAEVVIEIQKSTIQVQSCTTEVLAGLPQRVEIVVDMGSYFSPANTIVKISCSMGLTAADENSDGEFKEELEVNLPEAEPFTKVSVPLTVLADLHNNIDDDGCVIRKINATCTWCDVESATLLTFLTPLKTIMRLNSVMQKKFLHITVSGLSATTLELRAPTLQCAGSKLVDLNTARGQSLVIGSGLNASLLWELDLTSFEGNTGLVSFIFTVQYRPVGQASLSAFYAYKCHFDINNFKTLFISKCNLEARKDADFCRVGAMCQLNVEVTRTDIDNSNDASLMYEVLADQAMWAICGRAAGVMTLDQERSQSVMLDVMPLTPGYLPLPHVRLSRYIPAFDKDSGRGENSRPRLEAFSSGQVYSASKSEQVHVLPAGTSE